MNAAFRRGEAIIRLENYAPVIVEHLALRAWYGDHGAKGHWDSELKAFTKTLSRYNTGKGSKDNFTTEIVEDALLQMIESNDDKDHLLIGVEGHGVIAPESPDWGALQVAIKEFAQLITKPTKKR